MAEGKKYKKPLFYPKIWMGFSLSDWLLVLWESKFRIGLSSIHSFIFITISSIIRLLLSWIEYWVYQRQLSNTRIELAPVFIIGHWRSGTTLLHELMAMDKQFSYADTYQCFSPNTFLFPGPILRTLVGWFLPETRPMDSMPMGISKPQEDEFALCILGAPSPYRGIIFPKMLKEYGRYLRISDLSEGLQQKWKDVFTRFLTKLTLLSNKRIVLKSPTHSFRVALLSRMFPGARFIYIRRDPYTVYKSTQHLWMTLLNNQGLHSVDAKIVDQYVKDTYVALCKAVEQDRLEIPDGQFCEVSYEELAANPVKTVEKIYASTNLQGFDSVRGQIEEFEQQNRDYKTNAYSSLSTEENQELNRVWGKYILQQGYELKD